MSFSRHPLLWVDAGLSVALLIAYIAVRAATPVWPRPFHFPSGLMTVSMIMFLGAASFVTHVARRAGARGDGVMQQRMLALTLVGWASFLMLLLMEWARLLLVERVTLLSNPWNVPALGLFYYGLTAFVAIHLAAGAIWLLPIVSRPRPASLAAAARLVDFSTALFVVMAFAMILSATDLGGF